MKNLNNKRILDLDSAGLHNADIFNSHYFCVYSPDFRQLMLDSGISHKYKLTSKELDVYVESLDNAYSPEYINQTGVIAVWNDYILDRDLPHYEESTVKKIMNELENYIQSLVDKIFNVIYF